MRWLRIDNQSEIPVIKKVDLLVVGGGIKGLPIAEMAARRNQKVLIIESGTFLGREITKCQRPWFKWKQDKMDIARRWLPTGEIGGECNEEGKIMPIHIGNFKREIEDRLLDVKVEILYGSTPIGCFKQDDWIVSIGNKSGRQCIVAKEIVDTTDNRIISRLIDNPSGFSNIPVMGTHSPEAKELVASRTIEFTNVEEGYKSSYILPKLYNLVDGRVYVYPGIYDENHIFVDIPMIIHTTEGSQMSQDMEIEYLARKLSLEVASFLVSNVKEFDQAVMGFGSLEVMNNRNFDPLVALEEGIRFGEKICDGLYKDQIFDIWCTRDLKMDGAQGYQCNAGYNVQEIVGKCEYRENNEFTKLRKFPTIPMELKGIPKMAEKDVLVVGGGTSGIAAAWMAVREGVNTGIVDMNAALGGTATVGGVNKYWFGNKNGITEEIDRRVTEWSGKLKYPQEFYIWSKDDVWSIEIKSYVLLELCLEMGIEVFLNSTTIGTLVEDNSVIGVALATPYGVVGVTGKVIVDATGDGDVAAFAGAHYVYGNQRDSMTMWASLAQYPRPGESQNNFNGTVDVGDVFDYTRKILEGRRFGGELYDQGSYLAPRETRHILGDITLTLEDQLLMRKYRDTIAVCYSNYDPKGPSTSDLIYFGILPPHMEINIPYGALLPKGLEQIIVTGKAISCTHDAFPAIRMQKDLQQQGGAAGIAAALAVKKGVEPRILPVELIQRKLVELNIISARALEKENKVKEYNYKKIIDELDGYEPFEWLEMELTERAEEISPIILLCTADEKDVTELLLNAFHEAQGKKKLLLARLLLWHRRKEGLDIVIEEIQKQFKEDPLLPRRKGSIRFTTILPDHGVMTETTYLINSLSRAPDKRVMFIFGDLVERICKAERNYLDTRAGIFNYIESVAYGAENLTFPEFIPLLKRLMDLPELQNPVRTEGLELDELGERLSYLSLRLARALARCGDREGFARLWAFTEDKRSILAKSAYAELQRD